ncbi:GIY-YIG nuclease family protein, partial [Jejuia pallidilutea]
NKPIPRLPRLRPSNNEEILYLGMHKSYVYFMTNKNNTVIYIGVTSNLTKRVYQHKTKEFKGFTAKYNCEKLVYFEEYSDISDAISREKQLKAGNRKRKEALINKDNPDWNDLSDGWLFYFS